MAIGKVKWFNESKGFGFIEQPNGEDIFVHYTAIQGEGTRTLPEGAEVSFELNPTRPGPEAIRVQLLKSKELQGD